MKLKFIHVESGLHVIPYFPWKWFQFVIFYLTIISLWVSIYTFAIPRNTIYKKPHIGCIVTYKNLFIIKRNSFQRKHELFTPFFLQQPFDCNWRSTNLRTNYRVQNWSNILESFITMLNDFEKQWLNSFACKAIFIRPVPQKFICWAKERKKLFQMRKNVRKNT